MRVKWKAGYGRWKMGYEVGVWSFWAVLIQVSLEDPIVFRLGANSAS